MTIFEKLKTMDINELAAYIKENWIHDNDPVMTWWDSNYCNNCEPEIVDTPVRKMECAWCEIHGKCKHFPEKDELPSCLEMIVGWLNSEIKNCNERSKNEQV